MALFLSFLIFGLSIVSFFCAIVTLIDKNKGKNSIYFALTSIGSMIWGIGFGFLLIQKTPSAALNCRAIGMVGTITCLVFGIKFFSNIASSPKWLKIAVSIYSYIGICIYPFLVMPERQTFYMSDFGMSYTFTKDIWNTIYNTYIVFYMIFCVAMLIIMRKTAIYKRTKVLNNGLWLFMIIMALGTVLDTALPMVGIVAFPGSTIGQFIAIYIGFLTLMYQKKNSLTLQTVSNHIYHSIDLPIIVINNNVIIEFMSDAGYKFFNVDKNNLRMININSIFDLNDSIVNILENQTNIECTVKNNNAYCNITIEKVRDNFKDIIGYILIVTDLTEKNQYITELKEAKEIAEKAREDAEIASKSKDNFLANMSHELRTPLNAIIGMNQLIQNDEDKTKITDYSNQIEKSSRNLLSMIDELFDYSMIQSGKLDIVEQPYSIIELIKSVISSYKDNIKDKGLIYKINIDKDVPSILMGDEKRIKQCIVNILKNSIKYTDNGKITINVKSTVENNTCNLNIEITDSGIGIKNEDLQNLFVSFKGLEVTNNRNYEGIGVGLNIVRKLMILMNGKFEISSELNKGTKCILKIPQIVVDPTASGGYSNVNSLCDVCIIGNNSVETTVLKKILQKEYVDVDIMTNVDYKLLNEKQYDYIFVNYDESNLINIEKDNIIYLVDNNVELNGKKTLTKPIKIAQLLNIIKKKDDDKPKELYCPKVKMLAVDDNKLNLVVLKGFLKKTGANVEICNSGAEGLSLTEKNTYDIIFLDHMMPGMDGVETLKQIKLQNTFNSNIPIIVVTANAVEGAREYYLEQGFIDYISKPVNSEYLNEVLYKYLPTNKIEKKEETQ